MIDEFRCRRAVCTDDSPSIGSPVCSNSLVRLEVRESTWWNFEKPDRQEKNVCNNNTGEKSVSELFAIKGKGDQNCNTFKGKRSKKFYGNFVNSFVDLANIYCYLKLQCLKNKNFFFFFPFIFCFAFVNFLLKFEIWFLTELES